MNAILYINKTGCHLHSLARKIIGRNENPGMGIIDSKSVKTSHHADLSCKGIDGNKKVKGRSEGD